MLRCLAPLLRYQACVGATRVQHLCACWCVVVRRTRRRESPVLRFVGFPLTLLLEMVTAVAVSIFNETLHHLWLIALAVTTGIHSICRLDLLLASSQTRTPLHIYRHHNEPRVQLYVPKEETFPIPVKYMDVTRATHTDLDVMQEKRIDDYSNVDATRSLSDSKGYMWSCLRTFKQLPDLISCGLKDGAKFGKPLRIEKNKNGKTKNQNSTMLRRIQGNP